MELYERGRLNLIVCLPFFPSSRRMRTASFPGPFPWFGCGAPSQGKGPGNKVGVSESTERARMVFRGIWNERKRTVLQ